MLTGCNCFQIWQRVLCVGMKGLVSAHFLCKLAYSIHSSLPSSPGLCHSACEGVFPPAQCSVLYGGFSPLLGIAPSCAVMGICSRWLMGDANAGSRILHLLFGFARLGLCSSLGRDQQLQSSLLMGCKEGGT